MTKQSDTVWQKWQCGGHARWTSVYGSPLYEDLTGTICNFSGCNCGTKVTSHGHAHSAAEASRWFHRPEKARIVKHHQRHFTIVNDSTSPITRLWEALWPFGALEVRDLKQECEEWLSRNGYHPLEGNNRTKWVKA